MCSVFGRFSCVRLFVTSWTVASPVMPSGDIPNPGIRPMSPASPPLQANSLPLSHQGSPNIFYMDILNIHVCIIFNCLFISVVCVKFTYIILGYLLFFEDLQKCECLRQFKTTLKTRKVLIKI